MILPKNMRAVVTGSASGIGRAFCVEIGKRKGSVLGADIDEAGARETALLVERAGGIGLSTRCDVSKLEDVERLAAEAEERLGGLDLVVNNAGVAVGGKVGDVPIDDWRWLMDINLWGVIYGCHVFVPRMRAQGFGAVVNVASAAGIVAGPQMGPYNVSKAGVIALSETLASELHGSGVGVTVLCPTFIRTNIGKSSRSLDARASAMVEKLMDRAKLTADDVAAITLDATSRELYVLPQQDARWLWRMKRADPARFYKMIASEFMTQMNRDEPPGLSSLVRGLLKSLQGRGNVTQA